MNFKTALLALVFTFFNIISKAYADVDLSTGSLTLSHIDFTTKNQTNFKIIRDYNHKTNSKGLFGNKWCSNIEEKLNFEYENTITISKCNKNTDIIFNKKDSYYISNVGKEILKLVPGEKGYVRVGIDNIYSYNMSGDLIAISEKQSPDKPFIRYYYDGSGLISKIIYLQKYHYIFNIDPNKKVIKGISGPNKLKITYEYDESNNLISVMDTWKNKITYRYDNQNRITDVVLSDQDKSSIQYSNKNFVEKIIGPDGCTATYNYLSDIKKSQFTGTYTDSCTEEKLTFKTDKSPLFFKNKKTIEQLSRIQPKIDPEMLNLENNTWKKITSNKFQWEYIENQEGGVSEVKEINLQNKTTNYLKVSYKDKKISGLTLNNETEVVFIYNNDKLEKFKFSNDIKKSYETVNLFARFYTEIEKNIR